MAHGNLNPHISQRMTKANMILETCKKAFDSKMEDTGININFIISSVCLEFGAGRRYVKEVIDDLVNVKKLQIVEKKLYYIEDAK